MNKYLGNTFMHQCLIQAGIECVDGDLKWILSTQTVAQTDRVMSIIENTRYLPNKGMANEVEGIVSISTDKKNINDTRIDIVNVT